MKQRGAAGRVLSDMNLIAALSARDTRDAEADTRDATAIVAALYAEHALGLTRLAQVMLGDRAAAEDVVHDAFCGLCRRWDHLTDARRAPAYLRSSVLNGCHSVLRRKARGGQVPTLGDEALEGAATGTGADGPLLASEDRRVVLAALRRLGPPRTAGWPSSNAR
jgi:DNA-directed RNA polymerase specialized sigma24 family protein